jgi:hypothetical protein
VRIGMKSQPSVLRKPAVPTLSQMIRDGQASAAKIKRATHEAGNVPYFVETRLTAIAL